MTLNILLNFPSDCPVSFDIKQFIMTLSTLIPIDSGQLEFSFINDTTMIDLHQTHLHSATTTDIITFNLGTEKEPDGDIYICIDEAKRNASQLNHSFDHEIQTLITHGLLHLIGFTDTNPHSKKTMFLEQSRLLDLAQKCL